MFERFTEQARQVVVHAQQEARLLVLHEDGVEPDAVRAALTARGS
jgi:hypothetical protein